VFLPRLNHGVQIPGCGVRKARAGAEDEPTILNDTLDQLLNAILNVLRRSRPSSAHRARCCKCRPINPTSSWPTS
jgi:hypothetical protein